MYIYESHLGGFYSSEYPLEFDDLYCEECGDSDREIGEFSSAEELWDYIKPHDLACLDCDKAYHCENECELVDSDIPYSYDILYTMDFLKKEFDVEKRYVYLICEDKETKQIYTQFCEEKEWGDYHSLPNSFSLNEELDRKIAFSLIPLIEKLIEKPAFIKEIKQDDTRHLIYKCIVEKDKFDKEGTASFYEDGWYGYFNKDNLILTERENFLKKYL